MSDPRKDAVIREQRKHINRVEDFAEKQLQQKHALEKQLYTILTELSEEVQNNEELREIMNEYPK